MTYSETMKLVKHRTRLIESIAVTRFTAAARAAAGSMARIPQAVSRAFAMAYVDPFRPQERPRDEDY